MKGKSIRVFSPHHISAKNNKLSLIPYISLQINTKIIVRPLQISVRKIIIIIPIISVQGKRKFSLIRFISFKKTTEFLCNTIVKLQVTIKYPIVFIITMQGRSNLLLLHMMLVEEITSNIIIPHHINGMKNLKCHLYKSIKFQEKSNCHFSPSYHWSCLIEYFISCHHICTM